MKDNFFMIFVIGIVLFGSTVFLAMKFLDENRRIVPYEEVTKTAKDAAKPSEIKQTVLGVHYTGEKFVPSQKTLSQNDAGEGCFLTIVNESEEKLAIRLGPHNPEGDDPVFPYSPIPPGESLTLDPRYRIERISLHNHLKPGPEVVIHLDPSCTLK